MKQFKILIDSCHVCKKCVGIAPRNIDPNFGLVVQPKNEKQEQACVEAMNACPGQAIVEVK